MIDAFPFDSRITGYDADGIPQYDHASNAEEFARLLESFLRSGVFGSEMCEVLADTGMYATVGVGNAILAGRYAYISIPESVLFDVAGTQPRIDTVVLRRDLSSDVNDVVVAIVKGTEAANPVRPALTRDGTVYELGLADVLIPANSSAVSQQNITDTRLDEERCGIVAAILAEIDTEVHQRQFVALLSDMQKALQEVYEGVEKVNIIERTATLLASGWSAEAPYSQTVAADGILGADAAFVDVDLTAALTVDEMSALNDAWGAVLKATAGTGSVTVVFSDVPEVDIPIKIKVVR